MKSLMPQKIWWNWLVTLSILTSPFYGMPVYVQSASAEESTESDYSKGQNLAIETDDLQKRATYPYIPRVGATGLPTDAEMNDIQTRLLALKKSYDNTLEARIRSTVGAQNEIQLAVEINTYFVSVQRFEGIRILMGHPSEPSAWNSIYGLKVTMDDLSQLNFLSEVAALSRNFILLPGAVLPLDKIRELLAFGFGFSSHLDNVQGKWLLSFDLSTTFLENFSTLQLTSNPSTRNVLLYSIEWSAAQLYSSWARVLKMAGQSPAKMDEIPKPLRDQFVNLRTKREQLLRADILDIYATQKPQIFKTVLDTMDAAYKNNSGSVIDENFIRTTNQLLQYQTNESELAQTVKDARENERKSFEVALTSLVGLIDLKDWYGQTEYLIRESKRMALRYLYLANDKMEFSDEAKQQVSDMIDTRVETFTKQVLANGTFNQKIYTVGRTFTTVRERQAEQSSFQTRMIQLSKSLGDYASKGINIAYLLKSQENNIKGLGPSEYVGSILSSIQNAESYQEGYDKFCIAFFTYLQAFSFPSLISPGYSLSTAFAAASKATWNPSVLIGTMDPRFLAELTANKDMRTKDLNDLVAIGKYLKFDVYETLPSIPYSEEKMEASPNSMHLDNSWLPHLLNASEMQLYYDAMKTDFYNSAPILGSQLEITNPMQSDKDAPLVWEFLASSNKDSDKTEMLNKELAKIEQQIKSNLNVLADQTLKLKDTQDDGLERVGSDLRVLITQASTISYGLQSYAGFKEYYQDIRQQLLEPGMVERNWNNFNSWSFMANSAVMGYYAVKFLVAVTSGRLAAIGKVTDFIGKALAPAFGIDLARLNLFLFGTMGIPLTKMGLDSFYTGPSKLDTLNRFFACGADHGCVALYSDVTLQQQIINSSRTELAVMAASTVGIILGISLAGPALMRFAARPLANKVEMLSPQLDTLGLKADSSFSDANILQAANRAASEASGAGNLAQVASVRQARNAIEWQVWTEAKRWLKYDDRFAAAAKELGLSSKENNWKNLENLNRARAQVQANLKAGTISTYTYREQMSSIYSMVEVIRPIYQQMAENSLLANFMKRVWTTTSSVSESQISASERFYAQEFMAELDHNETSFYTGNLSHPVMVKGKIQNEAVQAYSNDPRMVRAWEEIASVMNRDPLTGLPEVSALLTLYKKRMAK